MLALALSACAPAPEVPAPAVVPPPPVAETPAPDAAPAAAAAPFPAGPAPARPGELPDVYVDVGACPGECCQYGTWTASKPVELVDAVGGGTVVATVAPGEKVRAVSGEVHTVPQAGTVQIATTLGEPIGGGTAVDVKPGDVVWGLTTLGEGYSVVWFGGQRFEVESMWRWDQDCRSADHASTTCWALPHAAFEERAWWVKIETKGGVAGWTNRPDDFSGFDACG